MKVNQNISYIAYCKLGYIGRYNNLQALKNYIELMLSYNKTFVIEGLKVTREIYSAIDTTELFINKYLKGK